MSSQKNKTKKSAAGFTIIEVVLVLAIAGLIFLMVFVALPALQRSQRDTARRNDMSRVDTALTQYQTNNMSSSNSTALPEGPSYWKGEGTFSCGTNVACSFVQRYMNSGTDSATNTFKDPDGEYYSVFITNNMAGSGTFDATNATTTGEGSTATTTTNAKLDASGTIYTVGTEFKNHVVYIVPGGECDGEYVKKASERHFAVLYRLEGASVYCIDDQ